MRRTGTSQRPKERSKDSCANEKEKEADNRGLHANAALSKMQGWGEESQAEQLRGGQGESW